MSRGKDEAFNPKRNPKRLTNDEAFEFAKEVFPNSEEVKPEIDPYTGPEPEEEPEEEPEGY